MQKIFPCLDIKKIFSPSLNVQQETIFSDGKSFAMINPWDCLEAVSYTHLTLPTSDLV